MTEWNRILCEEKYIPEEPDELVVNFVNFLKEKKKGGKVLDLGCGGGRHLIYLANQGFEAHGVDISETGLNLTRERLRRRNLEGSTIKNEMRFLPYIASCFDAVVCLHTIYHQKLIGIQDTISEICRVLRKGGFLLVNFLSKRTYIYGKGIKVEEDTFIRQDDSEKGVIHYFTDKGRVEKLLKGFKIVTMELRERKVEKHLQSRWVVVATK